jgi:hypothetical protein
MGRSLRFRRVVAASAVLLGVGALAACTPKPAAPPKPPLVVNQPTTTTLPPPMAHLELSPTSASLSVEATYGHLTGQDFTVTNTGNATSGPVDINTDALLNAFINWLVPVDHCSGVALDPGDSCTFRLEPHVAKYWAFTTDPANLVVSASPGDSATASIVGTLTSDLQVPASLSPLFLASHVTPGTATADFEVQNVSDHAVGPLDFATAPDSGAGTWALVAPSAGTPCTQAITLAPHTTCDWGLQYSNATGAGQSVVVVDIDGNDGSHAGGVALGVGAP